MICSSLPHRQLRKPIGRSVAWDQCSLPHRQLRNTAPLRGPRFAQFTAAQAA